MIDPEHIELSCPACGKTAGKSTEWLASNNSLTCSGCGITIELVEGNKLDVPFVKQTQQESCGAAALQMVYGHLGVKTGKQRKIFNKLAEADPETQHAKRIGIARMIEDAWDRKLYACDMQFDVSSAQAAYETMGWFVVKNGIPIIACQQWQPESRSVGHYRVVVGLTRTTVTIHDPNADAGYEEWPIEKFLEYWQKLGLNVQAGGSLIILKNRHPDLPSVEATRNKIERYRAERAILTTTST